jgi:hypothetical protein
MNVDEVRSWWRLARPVIEKLGGFAYGHDAGRDSAAQAELLVSWMNRLCALPKPEAGTNGGER